MSTSKLESGFSPNPRINSVKQDFLDVWGKLQTFIIKKVVANFCLFGLHGYLYVEYVISKLKKILKWPGRKNFLSPGFTREEWYSLLIYMIGLLSITLMVLGISLDKEYLIYSSAGLAVVMIVIAHLLGKFN